MAKGPAHLGTSGPHPCDGLINRQVDQRRTRRVVGCRSSRATPVLVWRRTATGALGDSGRSARLPRTSDGDGSRGH